MRLPILFVAALLLASCAAMDPHNVIGRQLADVEGGSTSVVSGPPSTVLDAQARERAFDFVWQTINERYYDPNLNGVDWNAIGMRYRPLAHSAANDEAFWELLDRMTGELKDAHTRVESPRRVALRKRDEAISMGFSFLPVEGKLAVLSVSPESDAWWAGVRPGMTLESVQGEPAAQVYERLMADTRLDSTDRSRHLRVMRRLVSGDEGTAMQVAFERADGSRLDTHLTRRKLSTRAMAIHRLLPSGFGYVRLTQWTLGVMPRAFEGLDALKSAPGLVIDLRGNPGGSLHGVNAFMARFFPDKTEVGRVLTRTGRPISLFFGTVEVIKLKTVVDGDADAYRGPVVVLVNSMSGSASELFAATMQATRRAVVVGEPSCGCLLGFLGYARVPGGAELAYSEVGFVMPNGKRIEGEGVIPDYAAPVTLSDLRVNRDRALERAQDILRTLPRWKP
jgi:carboxyl-terminal processing protease